MTVRDVAAIFGAVSYVGFTPGIGGMAAIGGISRAELDTVLEEAMGSAAAEDASHRMQSEGGDSPMRHARGSSFELGDFVGNKSDGGVVLVIAAVFSDKSFMVSGHVKALRRAITILERARHRQVRLLDVPYAYHSPLHRLEFNAIRAPDAAASSAALSGRAGSEGRVAARLRSRASPPLAYASCTSGGWVAPGENASWMRNWQEIYERPVNCDGALACLHAGGGPSNAPPIDVLLDLSVRADLTYYASVWSLDRARSRRAAQSGAVERERDFTTVGTIRPGFADDERLLLAATEIALHGCEIDARLALRGPGYDRAAGAEEGGR